MNSVLRIFENIFVFMRLLLVFFQVWLLWRFDFLIGMISIFQVRITKT